MDPSRSTLSRGMGSPTSPPRRPHAVDPFALLYRAHISLVYRAAHRAGVPDRDVPDVAQRVFISLHDAIGRGLDTSASLRGWLRKTTYHAARDHLALRRNVREMMSATGEIETVDRAPNPEERVAGIEAREHVDAVLDELPPELRMVLAMSDLDDLPMSEIAEVLEIPIGTGYTRLYAARRAFGSAWEERRAGSHAAILPFALWDARSLLAAERPIPDAPPGFDDEVWRRLIGTLGPGIAGAGGAFAAAAATGASAAKAGVVSVKQLAIGVVLSALAGAGLHAGLRAVVASRSAPDTVIAAEETRPAAAAVPATAPGEARSAVPAAIAAATVSTDAGAPTLDSAAAERLLLQRARNALDRAERAEDDGARAREIASALEALNRHARTFRSPRFAEEREELRRQVVAYQRAAESGGQR